VKEPIARSQITLGGLFMNIIIEKDAANYIKKHSKDNTVTLLIKTSSGG
jgi:hypothetical protein